ncbi:MAG TPA: DNRLRE domain-containing protein [Solirubrobacteraceae bacterium]
MGTLMLLAAFAGGTVAFGDEPTPPTAPLPEGPPRVIGEVKQNRTATSRTLELSDGSFRTEEFLSAINYRDDRGEWVPIDNTLVADGDGFSSRANDVQVQIPTNLDDGPVGLDAGGRSVGFELQGADAAATVDGETATFREALPHVSVSYEALGRAVKETLTLASSAAEDTYDFDLSASAGLSPRLEDSGAVDLVDGEGRSRFRIDAPWMRDAAGVYSGDARYRLVEEAGRHVLRLEVSRAWLDDPDRQYPVEIDPSTSVDAANVCHLVDGQSADFIDCQATAANLLVGRPQGRDVHRTIVNLSLAAIPAHAVIREANLVASFNSRLGADTTQVDLLPLQRTWSTQATWNEARPGYPWVGGLAVTESDRPERESRTILNDANFGTDISFPMTRLAQAWKDGEEIRYGILLKSTDEIHETITALGNPHVVVDWKYRTGRSRDYTYEQIGPARDTSVAVNVGNGNLAYASFDFSFAANGGAVQANRLYNSRDMHVNRQFGIDGRSNGPLNVSLQRFPDSGDYYFDGPNSIAGSYHRRPDGTYRSPNIFASTTLGKDSSGRPYIVFADTGERWEFGSEVPYGPIGLSTVSRIIRRNDTSTSAISHTNSTVSDLDGSRSSTTFYPAATPLSLTQSFGTDTNVDTAATDAGQNITYTYDPATARLTQARQSSTVWANYSYDTSGRINAITTNGGKTTLVYDQYDRVTSATYDPAGATTPSETTTFTYTTSTAGCAATDVGKTTVTRPDGSTRTFCPSAKLYVDDDWDPTPTPKGAWYDLRDDYVDGSGTHQVTLAAEDAGTGVTRVALAEIKSDGTTVERASVRTGCALRDAYASPSILNDPLCPTKYSTSTTINAGPLAEGAHRYRMTAQDRAQPGARTGESPVWTVYVDRTPPSAPTAFRLDAFDAASGDAYVSWESTDPDLADGSPGSGRADGEARYSVNGGSFSNWAPVDGTQLRVPGRAPSDTLVVEARSFDDVGRESSTGRSGTIAVVAVPEDPEVETMAVDWFVGQYDVTASTGRTWLRTQGRAAGMDDAIARVTSGEFAGMWFDNDARRIRVGYKLGTPTASIQDVVDQYGLAAETDLVEVQSSIHDLELGMARVIAALGDLPANGRAFPGRDESHNRIRIDVAPTLTTVERARVDSAAAQAGVQVVVEVADSAEELDFDATKCDFKERTCDRPLRGGVVLSGNPSGTECTAGFVMKSESDAKPYLLTAGHCGQESFDTLSSNGSIHRIGNVHKSVYGADGDAEIIEITGESYDTDYTNAVLVTKSGERGAPGARTARDSAYRIFGRGKSSTGRVLCLTGEKTGSHCGEVRALDQLVRESEEGEPDTLVGHMGLLNRCAKKKVAPNDPTDLGDSGGPVFRENKAYGILSGQSRGRRCTLAYQGMAGVKDLLHVTPHTFPFGF